MRPPSQSNKHLIEVALAHHQAGQLEQAQKIYRQVLKSQPRNADALHLLGMATWQDGDPNLAVTLIKKAIAVKDKEAIFHNNLGNILQTSGMFEEAMPHIKRALMLAPGYPEAHNNMGNILRDKGQLTNAIDCYRRAVELAPTYAKAYSNLGLALADLGNFDEAIAMYRKALTLAPDLSGAHGNLLSALNFQSGSDMAQIFEEHRRWGKNHADYLSVDLPPYPNEPDARRRLRIGYVSPDLCHHAVSYFIEPILSCHDKSQVEVFCYAEVKRPDEVTRRFQQYADQWHSTVGLSDDAVAQLIRSHQIDILVDLAGHTVNNRLMVFARKPAPIQVTYLGYPSTTGLAAMDYRLTDNYADPSGAENYYTESLLRLPDSLWCYRTSADLPEITDLPAERNGYVTFGSYTGCSRVGDEVIALWARLLIATPGSRLLLTRFPAGEVRQRAEQRFASHGILADRLEFVGRLPPAEFAQLYLRADIALDTFPVNGATTTCETLWMGVPVVTLSGKRFLSRAGLSVMTAAGLPDFVADTTETYLDIAIHLANNLPLLAEFHKGLRQHVAASPLTDGTKFTRHLEKIYREIWEKWCISHQLKLGK